MFSRENITRSHKASKAFKFSHAPLAEPTLRFNDKAVHVGVRQSLKFQTQSTSLERYMYIHAFHMHLIGTMYLCVSPPRVTVQYIHMFSWCYLPLHRDKGGYRRRPKLLSFRSTRKNGGHESKDKNGISLVQSFERFHLCPVGFCATYRPRPVHVGRRGCNATGCQANWL
jgi:hypothetical protein